VHRRVKNGPHRHVAVGSLRYGMRVDTSEVSRKLDLVIKKSHRNILQELMMGRLNGCMKTTPNTRPSNVTPFVLEGCWPLDGLDQATLRSLSRAAKRKRVGVADVIYESVESFIAKCEAEADLETKIIKFRRR
jgi:hypothetical protein